MKKIEIFLLPIPIIKRALQLDPESKEARQALARVKGQISEGEFQALMSEGVDGPA